MGRVWAQSCPIKAQVSRRNNSNFLVPSLDEIGPIGDPLFLIMHEFCSVSRAACWAQFVKFWAILASTFPSCLHAPAICGSTGMTLHKIAEQF